VRRVLFPICLALLALGVAQVGAAADTPSGDPQQQQSVLDQIRTQLSSNLADALMAQDQLQQSLDDNAAQQQSVGDDITTVEAKIADLNAEIADAQRRIDQLNWRIGTEQEQIAELERAMYEAPTSVLVILGESQSLGDMLTRVADLNVASSRASDLKSSLNHDLGQVQALQQKEQSDRLAQVAQQNQLTSELAQLQVLQAQQQKSMADLETKIAQTRYELYQINTQSAALAQEITDMLLQQQDAIIAAAMQSVWTQLELWTQSNSVGSIPTSAGHSTKYRFIWPEPNAQISQPFGPSQLALEPPYNGYPHFHTGIDLVEPFGSPVYAADDGVVALVGSSTSGYGNYVVIAHSGGLDTLYGHLSASLVKVGQTVNQGQVVGLEGSTGNSTGPHLHFELRINQKPVDPTLYLPPGPPSPFKQ